MAYYRKLRAALAEKDMHAYELADSLHMQPMSISARMTGRIQWKVDEAYQVLDILEISHDRIFEYFPPEGKVPM